jgi:hypothetical protein
MDAFDSEMFNWFQPNDNSKRKEKIEIVIADYKRIIDSALVQVRDFLVSANETERINIRSRLPQIWKLFRIGSDTANGLSAYVIILENLNEKLKVYANSLVPGNPRVKEKHYLGSEELIILCRCEETSFPIIFFKQLQRDDRIYFCYNSNLGDEMKTFWNYEEINNLFGELNRNAPIIVLAQKHYYPSCINRNLSGPELIVLMTKCLQKLFEKAYSDLEEVCLSNEKGTQS